MAEENGVEQAAPIIQSKVAQLRPPGLTLTLEPAQWDLIRNVLGQVCNYNQARPIIEAMEKQLEGRPVAPVRPPIPPQGA